MGPGFRRENGSKSCQFFISIWILAQPHSVTRHRSRRRCGGFTRPTRSHSNRWQFLIQIKGGLRGYWLNAWLRHDAQIGGRDGRGFAR